MLEKLFIKDYANVKNSAVRNAYGTLTSIVGICCNVVLSAAKIVVGILFHSLAILADGINNVSDAGSSFVSLLGFRLARRPADREHPFGHERYEYITGLIIAFIIMFLGLQLVMSSVDKIVAPVAATASYIAIGVLAFSILLKTWMCFYYRRTAKLIDSLTLKAASMDSRNDVIATGVVLICTLISFFSPIPLDGYAGLAVALFILYSGFKMVRETLSPLLGEVPTQTLVEDTCKMIRAYPGVLGLHDLVIHNYGPDALYVSVHVEVDARVDILLSHELIDSIERDFLERGVHLVIHLDPIVTDNEQLNALHSLVCGTVASIDKRLKVHDFRAVLGKNNSNLIFDVVVPFDFPDSDDDLKTEIQQRVKAQNPALTTVVSFDHNYVGSVEE